MKQSMKRWIAVLVGLVVLVSGGYTLLQQSGSAEASPPATESVQRGVLDLVVDAPGMVQANQTALLVWRARGTVGRSPVVLGQQVKTGDMLAELDPASLQQALILAQAQRVDAQKALDNLIQGQMQRAQAQKAVENARQALEDARDPVVTQASAQLAVANAQKGVDLAKDTLEMVTKPADQQAVDQAYATLLLAKKALDDLQRQVDRIEGRLNRPASTYYFFENKPFYRKILQALEIQLLTKQREFDEAQQRYQALLEPVDPQDVMLAQANLLKAQAVLAAAERDAQRLAAGSTPGQIAVLSAQLADAEREYARWQDGPDESRVAAASARLQAIDATLELASLIAPFDGTITQAAVKAGDQVNPGSLAFRLDDLTALLATVQVSEVSINKVKVGDAAELHFDAIDSRLYQGRVSDVSPVGKTVNGITTFQVKILVLDADVEVRPGMTVEASIITQQLQDVLLVPGKALRFRDGKQVVIVQRSGQSVAVPVTLGAVGKDYVQVLENENGGLAAGDLVILDPPEALMQP